MDPPPTHTHTSLFYPTLCHFPAEQFLKNGDLLRTLLKLFAVQPWSGHFI